MGDGFGAKPVADSEQRDGTSPRCDQCGGTHVHRNGRYAVLDWRWLQRWWVVRGGRWGRRVEVQRHRCVPCGREVHGRQFHELRRARAEAKQVLARALAFGRFGLELSLRKRQLLLGFFYGYELSLARLAQVEQALGARARRALLVLNACAQEVASVAGRVDETYVYIGNKAQAVALVLCTLGVVRAVKYLGTVNAAKARRLLAQVRRCGFRPPYWLSDFAKPFQQLASTGVPGAVYLFDWVHAARIIHRLFEEAIRQTTLLTPKRAHPDQAQRRAQLKLKRSLLRKRLAPIRWLLFEALKTRDPSQAQVFLDVALLELESLDRIAAVRTLHTQLTKFFAKYPEKLLLASTLEDVPATSNYVEGVVSVLKDFCKQLRSFRRIGTMIHTVCGKALWYNCFVRRRGAWKGQSVLQRAGLQAPYGSFFEALGLDWSLEAPGGLSPGLPPPRRTATLCPAVRSPAVVPGGRSLPAQAHSASAGGTLASQRGRPRRRLDCCHWLSQNAAPNQNIPQPQSQNSRPCRFL